MTNVEAIRQLDKLADHAQKAANACPPNEVQMYRDFLEVRDHCREAMVKLLPAVAVKMVKVGKTLCTGCGDNHAPFMCP